MKKLVLFVILNTLTISVWGQRICATTEVNQQNKTVSEQIYERENFENWLVQKKSQVIADNALQGEAAITIYQIPVVVHVIHIGEAYGVGFNITDEQIKSQLDVLTRDFRHLNADSVNTPANFQPLMSDIGFEFILAKRDPNGLPTNGITRSDGNSTSWGFSNNVALKSISYWNSSDYMNIWVAPLSNGLLGWAEFPTSGTLDGLNNVAVNNPLTDGVVITSRAFGSKELYPAGNYYAKFDLGRTATHELGHFFGLRHISGDGNCTVDDYVIDTPLTKSNYFNCPPEGTLSNSCSTEPSMFMNYLDLVDDNCMNLFTLGQKERMLIIINNSPRRASLLTSMALEPPPPLDAAITSIPSPEIGTCDAHIFPTITVQNTGLVDLTSVELSISVNNVEIGSQIFTVSLMANEDTVLALTDFFLTDFGTTNFTASILSTNGVTDDLSGNNTINKQIFFSEVVTGMNEDFTNWPQAWAIRSDAPVSQWNFLRAPNVQITNTAAILSYYQNESPFLDELVSPILNLSSYTNPYLLFDYAYGEVKFYNDELAVVVSVDCGINFLDTLFLKSGKTLATTEIPTRFTPSGHVDWRTSVLDLSAYTSIPIQIAFVGKSDGGNNIYLDNFLIIDNTYNDIKIKGMVNESGAFSANNTSIGLIIENSGTVELSDIIIEASEDNNSSSTQSFNNLNLLPGEQTIIDFANNFSTGTHELRFKILNSDAKPENNELIVSANFFTKAEPLPFKGYFNNNEWNSLNDWTLSSPNDTTTWKLWPSSNDFIFYSSFSPGNAGLRDWLVLPQLDFSQTSFASLQYKVAYASNELNNEYLRVKISINGGKSFDFLAESLTASEMSTYISNDEWAPQLKKDWQTRFIDLSAYSGQDDILIAFEVIDGDGNNVYLDDIELFVSDEPGLVKLDNDNMAIYPNPVNGIYTNITFNLETKQDVIIRILDVNGKTMSHEQYTDILNQTLPIELASTRNGIYIIQTIGKDFTDITRILVNR